MIVKICGITTLDDARFVLDAGADWIGLNLVSGPRKLDASAVLSILKGLDDPARAVVLVIVGNGGADKSVASSLAEHGVRRLQLYGQVSSEALDSLRHRGFETIFVQPVGDERSLDFLESFLNASAGARPDYVLFDAAIRGQSGGTGHLANWETIARARSQSRFEDWPPVILAGGLTPGNVAVAIQRIAPAGVDVSSGVEFEPGRKAAHKVQAFLKAVRGDNGPVTRKS